MADNVHVPGLGEVKKPYLYGGIAAVVLIGGIMWYRNRQAAQAAAATTTSTDTSSQDPTAVDPNSPTGQTYAEEAAGNLGSFPYGGVSDYGGSYYGTGNITGYDQYGNPIYSTGITGNQVYTTNSDWATAAESDAATLNIDTATAATAISRILAGLSVTTQQQDLFMQLVGLLGQPPQGYPKPIKVTDSPGQPGPPGTSGTVTIPNVVGLEFGPAFNKLTNAGLISEPGKNGVNATWKVTAQSPKGGTKANKASIVKLTVPAPIPVHKPGK